MPHSSISLDVSESEIKNLKIGDNFEAKIKGRIVSLEKGREFETVAPEGEKSEVEKYPPSVRVELTSVKVEQPNEFSALVDDEDED